MLALDARSMRSVAPAKEARLVVASATAGVPSKPPTATRRARALRSQRRRRLSPSVVVAASDDDGSPSPRSSGSDEKKKRVVILGGTGRVGASTAAALAKGDGGREGLVELVLVGKPGEGSENDRDSPLPPAVSAACERVPSLRRAIVSVEHVDASDVEGLAKCFEGADCVIHCAGPFQSGGAGASSPPSSSSSVPAPLAAAIEAKVPYVDVCDDPDWAKLALSADDQAKRAGVPAITTAGVFPGLSGLMAAQMCSVARLERAPFGVRVSPKDDEDDGAVAAVAALARARAGASASTSSPAVATKTTKSTVTTFSETSIPEGATPSVPSRLRYSYFVAGSGGAGPAVLAATLLLAGREAVAWKDGARVSRPAFSEPFPADFGRFIGRKTVYLIDLPEVEAAAVDLRVPSVSARFATAPGVFNVGTVLLARLLPKSLLCDRKFAAAAAKVLAPLVAAADAALGALPVAIRVDLELTAGAGGESGGSSEQASSSVYVHRDMATAVGACAAAFARELLFGGSVAPGVRRPEALPSEARERILRDVAENSGAARLEVGSPPWKLDSEPKRLGFGMYW